MASQPPYHDHDATPLLAEQDSPRARVVVELQRQLDEAQSVIRRLTRELTKEQARHAQTAEAYSKTVTNMVEVARENAVLAHELERLKRIGRPAAVVERGSLPFDLTANEASVIRKAMARLHHPDVGGDEQRMKLWNAILDQIDGLEDR